MTSAPEASDLLACRTTEEAEEAFLAATRAEVSIIVEKMADASEGRTTDRLYSKTFFSHAGPIPSHSAGIVAAA